MRARTRPSPVPPPIDDSGSEPGETSTEGHQRLRENRKTDERFALLAMALVGMVIVFCFSTVIYLSYFQGSGSSVSGPRDSRQRASHPSGRKVKDSQRQLSISLADAYTGTKMEVRAGLRGDAAAAVALHGNTRVVAPSLVQIAVPHRVLCPKCGGLGHDPDVAPKQVYALALMPCVSPVCNRVLVVWQCPVCHGTGSQTFVQRFGRTTRKFRSTCVCCGAALGAANVGFASTQCTVTPLVIDCGTVQVPTLPWQRPGRRPGVPSVPRPPAHHPEGQVQARHQARLHVRRYHSCAPWWRPAPRRRPWRFGSPLACV